MTSVAWSPDGARLATGSADNMARVWDAASGALLRVVFGASDGWYAVDVGRDARGLWRGEGAALGRLRYSEPVAVTPPAPWIPRLWRAVDVPELRAPDVEPPHSSPAPPPGRTARRGSRRKARP